MDISLNSKTLTTYFHEISNDFLTNKKFSFKIHKKKRSSNYSCLFEGSYKSPHLENTNLITSKEINLQQKLFCSPFSTISLNYTPAKANGLEIGLKFIYESYRAKIMLIEFNRLSKKAQLSSLYLKFKHYPHNIKLHYNAMTTPYHEIELSYLINPIIQQQKDLYFGFNAIMKQKNFLIANYYEFFVKTVIKNYGFLFAVLSDKGNLEYKMLSATTILFAFQKKSANNVLNLILEHSLKEKTAVMTAVYENNIENAIHLKHMVSSNYQISSSLAYKLNEYLKIMQTSSINIKKLFNQGEKYKLGLGFSIEI